MTRRGGKAPANERDFPHIVEIALPVNGFNFRLSREMAAFHRSHDIETRFGRTTNRHNQLYCRWCFSDPSVADAFRQRFGGARLTIRPQTSTRG